MDTFHPHISSLMLPVLCERIESMLDTSHNALISSLAISYILQEIDTTDDLLEDLECGANDSGLIDHIISNTHQTNHEWTTDSINNLHQIIVNAINGESMRSHSNSYILGQKINDSLYDYLNYTYIFSEIVNELIMEGYNDNLLQIDLWIIPKNIETTLQIARDDSACSSDSESDDDDIENGTEFED